MKKCLILCTALFSLTGCGTIVQLVNPTKPYEMYSGTFYDWEQAQKWGLPILDIPLSFVLDTALLPYAWSQN